MKHSILWITGFSIFVSFNSCVSKKKFLESESMVNSLSRQNNELRTDITSLKSRLKLMEEANESASDQIENQKQTLNEKDAALSEREEKIKLLQSILDKQKENTENLRKKLASALGSFSSDELTVFTKNGKVYVSLSEKLLFESGSAEVNKEGKDALEKVAGALKENADIQVLVEGHTDTVPIKYRYKDNWELSVERSTSIVRLLTNEYGIDPTRVAASGKSQYEPVADNGTPEGRARNRRTEIILAPKLDEIMNLIAE